MIKDFNSKARLIHQEHWECASLVSISNISTFSRYLYTSFTSSSTNNVVVSTFKLGKTFSMLSVENCIIYLSVASEVLLMTFVSLSWAPTYLHTISYPFSEKIAVDSIVSCVCHRGLKRRLANKGKTVALRFKEISTLCSIKCSVTKPQRSRSPLKSSVDVWFCLSSTLLACACKRFSTYAISAPYKFAWIHLGLINLSFEAAGKLARCSQQDGEKSWRKLLNSNFTFYPNFSFCLSSWESFHQEFRSELSMEIFN